MKMLVMKMLPEIKTFPVKTFPDENGGRFSLTMISASGIRRKEQQQKRTAEEKEVMLF